MLLELFFITYGIDGDAGYSPSLMFSDVIRRSLNNSVGNTATSDNNTLNALQPVAAPVSANATGDDTDKSIFILGILIGFCVFAVVGVTMTVVCWIRISNAKKPKDTEFKAKDAENLDKQNMRDVQLSEYEKRKRQMKELDNQQEEPPDDQLDESDDGGELDEITAVQSQPLEEETIVNPNFIHHYIPRQSSRSGSIRSS
ncbi:uncharacterized protein LOC134820728 isoform X1 [Bolinopsis microptera]|uniref:uncharacterized protein LOC134820728 isoform X1 n=2 Tax=Bolinopsis microptera TaxID=2820187 RepID=UPI003079AF44